MVLDPKHFRGNTAGILFRLLRMCGAAILLVRVPSIRMIQVINGLHSAMYVADFCGQVVVPRNAFARALFALATFAWS